MANQEKPKKTEKIVKRPSKKQDFKTFVLWRSLPSLLRDLNYTELEKLGFQDPLVMELLRIRWQKDFAERFNVDEGTLSEWNDKIEAENLIEYKGWAKDLSRNVILSLYRAILKEGKAPEVKLFLQVVEGWQEKSGVGINLGKLLEEDREEYA